MRGAANYRICCLINEKIVRLGRKMHHISANLAFGYKKLHGRQKRYKGATKIVATFFLSFFKFFTKVLAERQKKSAEGAIWQRHATACTCPNFNTFYIGPTLRKRTVYFISSLKN